MQLIWLNDIDSVFPTVLSWLGIPVAFGKKKEWKDGKQVETEEDNIINDANPLWTLKPVSYTHLFLILPFSLGICASSSHLK